MGRVMGRVADQPVPSFLWLPEAIKPRWGQRMGRVGTGYRKNFSFLSFFSRRHFQFLEIFLKQPVLLVPMASESLATRPITRPKLVLNSSQRAGRTHLEPI